MRTPDTVDHILEQWSNVRPDVDASPIAVIGRISRLSRLIDRRLEQNFARFGIEAWVYDMLATLRRSGEPYELTAGQLTEQTMITTGAITNRLDRLAERGFIERRQGSDRRVVLVRLTDAGRAKVDEVTPAHLEVEREILATLKDSERVRLTDTLRRLLLGLDDARS